jgi:hypothetical protein
MTDLLLAAIFLLAAIAIRTTARCLEDRLRRRRMWGSR